MPRQMRQKESINPQIVDSTRDFSGLPNRDDLHERRDDPGLGDSAGRAVGEQELTQIPARRSKAPRGRQDGCPTPLGGIQGITRPTTGGDRPE
jgi:hypothetical protein